MILFQIEHFHLRCGISQVAPFQYFSSVTMNQPEIWNLPDLVRKKLLNFVLMALKKNLTISG